MFECAKKAMSFSSGEALKREAEENGHGRGREWQGWLKCALDIQEMIWHDSKPGSTRSPRIEGGEDVVLKAQRHLTDPTESSET